MFASGDFRGLILPFSTYFKAQKSWLFVLAIPNLLIIGCTHFPVGLTPPRFLTDKGTYGLLMLSLAISLLTQFAFAASLGIFLNRKNGESWFPRLPFRSLSLVTLPYLLIALYGGILWLCLPRNWILFYEWTAYPLLVPLFIAPTLTYLTVRSVKNPIVGPLLGGLSCGLVYGVCEFLISDAYMTAKSINPYFLTLFRYPNELMALGASGILFSSLEFKSRRKLIYSLTAASLLFTTGYLLSAQTFRNFTSAENTVFANVESLRKESFQHWKEEKEVGRKYEALNLGDSAIPITRVSEYEKFMDVLSQLGPCEEPWYKMKSAGANNLPEPILFGQISGTRRCEVILRLEMGKKLIHTLGQSPRPFWLSEDHLKEGKQAASKLISGMVFNTRTVIQELIVIALLKMMIEQKLLDSSLLSSIQQVDSDLQAFRKESTHNPVNQLSEGRIAIQLRAIRPDIARRYEGEYEHETEVSLAAREKLTQIIQTAGFSIPYKRSG
jgi:hypothetical protein